MVMQPTALHPQQQLLLQQLLFLLPLPPSPTLLLLPPLSSRTSSLRSAPSVTISSSRCTGTTLRRRRCWGRSRSWLPWHPVLLLVGRGQRQGRADPLRSSLLRLLRLRDPQRQLLLRRGWLHKWPLLLPLQLPVQCQRLSASPHLLLHQRAAVPVLGPVRGALLRVVLVRLLAA
jgi:hypothetical protein